MPFPYETSATPVRVRRTKDKDSRNTAPSNSGKKQKRSGSSNRSPPHDRSGHAPLHTQQNLALDQLPALPESGTASPGSAASPVLQESSAATAQISEATFVAQHRTPAALQKYLQVGDDQPDHEDFPSQRDNEIPAERRISNVKEPQAYNQPLDSHTSTPLATSIREHPDPSYDRSLSPSFFSRLRHPYDNISLRTSSPRTVDHHSHTVSSPPPRSASSSVSQAVSIQDFPILEQPQPRSDHPYFASPPAFAPSIPLTSPFPHDQYPASVYTGPQYYPMTHPSFPHLELHPVASQNASPYANYSVQSQNPVPPGPLHHPPARGHSSTSSRMSATGEHQHVAHPTSNYMEMSPSMGSPGTSKQDGEDDAVDLLQRIQSAIPDLHVLVHRYRETSGQLGMRENLIKETEAKKLAALKQKESYIEKLAQELEDVKSKYSAESSKLRFEISNMEEKQKELHDSVAAEQKLKEEFQMKSQNLSTELERSRTKFEDERSKTVKELEAWKRKSAEDKKALEENLNRQQQQADKSLQSRLAELSQTHAQEKDALQSSFTRQKKELETKHVQARQELEKSLDVRQKALEESRRTHAEDKSVWEKERAILGKGSEEQRKILASQHQSEKEGMRKMQEASEAQIRRLAQDEAAKLRKQLDKTKADWNADRASCAKSTAELKAQAARIDDENKKLQKMADAFGEVTDLRSRGDPFYQDAFRHLERQIHDVAEEYFKTATGELSDKAAKSIRATLPSSYYNLDLSPDLRAAFVEFSISSIITRRIFAPFLFVLGGRLRSADVLFAEMSYNLKRKSTRREALWRQRTLHAAYTASSSKQSINRIATSIVDEISGAIQGFVEPAKWQYVAAAVRRIVKTAAETWRYARLESSLIVATMTGMGIDKASEGDIGATEPQARRKIPLLPLFPLIKREAAYGSFEDGFKPTDQGHIYSEGRVLYTEDLDPSAHTRGLQQEKVTGSAPMSPRESPAGKKPQSSKEPHSQSPPVPTKLPATMSAADADQSVLQGYEHGDGESGHAADEAGQSVETDAYSFRNPTEKNQATSHGSAASTRQSSIATTIDGEIKHPPGDPASILELEQTQRLGTSVESQ